MSGHYGENERNADMRRIITLPLQIVLGLLLMALLILHFNMAMFWLFFIGLVLLGSIFGAKPAKRRTAQTPDSK
ncbi:MAG: hypothetical protein ACI4NO_04340 [Oxalobacter sp.]